MDNANQQDSVDAMQATTSDQQDNDQIDPRLKNLHADGLTKSFHGIVYQLILLTYTAYRAHKLNRAFYLISEAREFEKFDDLVIDDNDKIIFVQAKHCSKQNSYSKKDFCATPDNDASLAKYYDSWIRLKGSKFTKFDNEMPKPSRYIFFTNRDVSHNTEFLEDYAIEPENDDFFIQNPSQTSKTLRFKKGRSRQSFIDAINAYSDEIKNCEVEVMKISKENITFSITVDNNKSSKVLRIKQLEDEIFNLSDMNRNGVCKTKGINCNNSVRAQALCALVQNSQKLQKNLIKRPNIKEQLEKLLKEQVKEENFPINRVLILLSGALDHKINQFLDEFEIKIKEPSVLELKELLVNEMKADMEIGPRQIYNGLMDRIMTWFQDRKICLLNAENFREFIAAEKADIQYISQMGNKMFEEDYEKYPLFACNKSKDKFFIQHSYLAIDELKNFLLSSLETNNTAIVMGVGIRARVYATIKFLLQKKEIAKSEWLYLDVVQLKDEENLEVFAASSLKYFVVDCLDIQITDTQFFDRINSSLTTANETQEKKVVILMRKEVAQMSSTKKFTNIEAGELENQQIREISLPFHDWYLNLGGKDYPFKDIILDKNSNFTGMISDLDFLCKISCNLKKEKSTIGNTLPYGIYVQNDLIKGDPVYDLIDLIHSTVCDIIAIDNVEDKQSFIEHLNRTLNRVNGDNEGATYENRFTDDEKKFNDEEIKYILISDKHLKNLESYVKNKVAIHIGKINHKYTKNYSLICIENMNGEFQSAKVTTCKPEGLILSKPSRYDISNGTKIDYSRGNFLKSGPNLSIISAKAGYGKSSFCLATRHQWTDQDSSNIKWLIYVLLPQLNLSASEGIEAVFTQIVTQTNWQSWEISLILKDLESKSNVTLLLDAFDEVKDEHHVKVINQWINKYSDKANIILTTRPHAFNKISLTKSIRSCNYYELKEYTKSQQSQYIREYTEAILKCKYEIDPKRINEIIAQVSNGINEKFTSIRNKGNCLYGIPLESYHFCEIITPPIVADLQTNNQVNLETVNLYVKTESFRTAWLIQQFIPIKMQLFLVKHFSVPNKTVLQRKHQIYSLMASYTELLMAFAYKQVFNLPYSFLSNYLSHYFYSPIMIDELNDVGFACVHRNGHFYIKFNHDTYQDYFAALFILKRIIIQDQLCHEIKCTIREHRYNRRYWLLLSLASQLSMIGDKIIPGYEPLNHNHQLQLWQILADESDDLLGAAENMLFVNCLRELSENHRQNLADLIGDKNWSKQLLESIKEIQQKGLSGSNDHGDDDRTRIPIVRTYAIEAVGCTNNEYNQISLDEVKLELKNKRNVIDSTKHLLKKNSLSPADLAKLFEEIIKDNNLNKYWDIDGGFSAMALLGNGFNQSLADYFIIKIDADPNWRAGPALNAIYSLYRDDLQLQSKQACLSIVPYFIRHKHHLKTEDQLYALINRNDKVIFKNFFHLPSYITNSVSLNCENLQDHPEMEILRPFVIFRSLLWIAMRLGYAVKFVENDQIQFIHESMTCLTLNGDFQSQIFALFQEYLLKKLQLESDKQKILEEVTYNSTVFIGEETSNDFEGPFCLKLAELTNKECHKNLMTNLVNGSPDLTRIIYSKLSKHNLITKKLAEILLRCAKHHQNEKFSYWPRSGGIQSIGYIGRFFNEDFSNFLLTRSKIWPDNFSLSQETLKRIGETLAKVAINDHDDCYRNAVSAFETCMERIESIR